MSRPLIVSALLIITAIFVVLFASALQSHQHVRLLQRQLNEAKQQLAQSKAANTELEKNVAKLNTELDEANSKSEQLAEDRGTAQSQLKEKEAHEQELTTELEKTKKETYAQLAAEKEANQKQFETITNEATKKLSESEKRVADLTEQLKSVSVERDLTQAKLSDTQSELEKAKETTQQANAKVEAIQTELDKATEEAEQANAKVTELESAGANTAKEAEIERGKLQAALDQANTEIERLKSEVEKQKPTPPEQGESVSPTPGERRL